MTLVNVTHSNRKKNYLTVCVIEHFVPGRTVQRIVSVMAKEFGPFSDGAARLHSHDSSESRMMEIDEFRVRFEGMVDLVREGCAVVFQRLTFDRNVKNLLLLFAQTNLVAIVLPVIESLKCFILKKVRF